MKSIAYAIVATAGIVGMCWAPKGVDAFICSVVVGTMVGVLIASRGDK